MLSRVPTIDPDQRAQQATTAPPDLALAAASGPQGVRLFRKRRSPVRAVTPRSLVLFRLGERCNNDCPMCSNTGDPALALIPTPELLRRAAFLRREGFRRAILTGGEPTVHPGFWTLAETLFKHGCSWDINTNGRTFAAPKQAERARRLGLKRAIVSLHAADPALSNRISGAPPQAHGQTVAGVEALRAAGVAVTVNLVLSRLNVPDLGAFLELCADRFGRRTTVKLTFPYLGGRGGGWEPIRALRLEDVAEPLRHARGLAASLGLPLVFESVPPCVLGDSDVRDVSRSGFGETHYLDEASGDVLHSIRHIEASLSVYPEFCRACPAFRRCPGVEEAYARLHGVGALRPFSPR